MSAICTVRIVLFEIIYLGMRPFFSQCLFLSWKRRIPRYTLFHFLTIPLTIHSCFSLILGACDISWKNEPPISISSHILLLLYISVPISVVFFFHPNYENQPSIIHTSFLSSMCNCCLLYVKSRIHSEKDLKGANKSKLIIPWHSSFSKLGLSPTLATGLPVWV